MPAHLRPLPRCRTCRSPASEMLYNGVNAPLGEYCTRHAKAALRDFQKNHETQTQGAQSEWDD